MGTLIGSLESVDVAGDWDRHKARDWWLDHVKLTIDGNVARLEGINAEKTHELITSGELELAHNPSLAVGLHITATGEEIEAFLRRFADDPALIGLENGFELQR